MNNNLRDGLRLKSILKNKVFIGPKNISIGITKRCNLTCKYCLGEPFDSFRRQHKNRAGDELSFKRFTEIADDCHNLGVEHITLCGGEPSLHPKIKKMIAYIKEKNMLFSMNSNGTFDKDLRMDLMEATLLNINISATNRKDYQMLQGGDKKLFNKVLDNIRCIAKNKTLEKSPIINITFVLNKYNFFHMEDMIDLARNICVDRIQFKIMRFNKNINDLAITHSYSKKFKKILKKVVETQGYKKISTNIKDICRLLVETDFNKHCEVTDFYGLFNGDFYFRRDYNDDFSCYYGWFSANIGPWGDVFFCCTNRLTYIGNIYEKSFEEIWNSKYAHKIRLAMKHNFNIKKRFWKPCTYCTN